MSDILKIETEIVNLKIEGQKVKTKIEEPKQHLRLRYIQ
jgi:hypothetical protein